MTAGAGAGAGASGSDAVCCLRTAPRAGEAGRARKEEEVKSEVDVEILPLEGVDADGSPGCECITTALRGWRVEWRSRPPCGRPSAARMRVRCRACGADYRLFLCRWHTWLFRLGLNVACRVCDRVGRTGSRPG